ncbi:MAG TPA: membrane dipeptidase [Paracoccaceae bacterium]|nr:membrane dipeptidase [Paracoccaceae bacterium]
MAGPVSRGLRVVGAVVAGVVASAVALVLTGVVADQIDRRLNPVHPLENPPEVGEADRARHAGLFPVDLHADTMLWDRDLLARADHGHVDLPRLIDGNVALQVFAVVTKTPNKTAAPDDARLIEGVAARECLSHDSLNTTMLLQIAQRRPLGTWFDLETRALHQAGRLKEFVAASEARRAEDPEAPVLLLIEDADDLAELVRRRADGEAVVGALLALEGAHWIGGEGAPVEAGVERLVEAGFRMVAPTHRFDNALASSGEGCDQLAGLSEDGRTFLRAAAGRGLILDLAHASDSGIAEAAATVDGPIVVSHTGLRRTCEPADGCVIERNMRDAEVQAVARTGGLVAVGYWPEAVGRGMDAVVAGFASARRALSDPDFVAEMRGARPDYDPLDHVALGSDYDGSVAVPFHVGDLALLTAALADAGFDDRAIARIAGANACRVFATRLPGGGPERAAEICGPLLEAR